jgi:excisionase family DNA binding protein
VKAWPTVALSPRVCAWLESEIDLRRLALSVRGVDDEFTEALHSIHLASLDWRELSSTSGSNADKAASAPSDSKDDPYLTSAAVAKRRGTSDRAVRLACLQGRIPHEKVGNRYQIRRSDADAYTPRTKVTSCQ